MHLSEEVRALRPKLPRLEWREREERHRSRLEKERKTLERIVEPLAGRSLELAARDVELLAAVEELRMFAKNRAQRHVLNQLSREIARDFVETYGFENAEAALNAAFPENGEPANGTPREEASIMQQEREYGGPEPEAGSPPPEEPGFFRRAGSRIREYARKPLVWGGAIAVIIIGGVAYALTRERADGGSSPVTE